MFQVFHSDLVVCLIDKIDLKYALQGKVFIVFECEKSGSGSYIMSIDDTCKRSVILSQNKYVVFREISNLSKLLAFINPL